MTIEAVDVFYLAMPSITEAADGTQDTVLVRVRDSSGIEGWGECDASPLVTIATYICPPSHGNIHGLRCLLLGEEIDGPADVVRIHSKVLRRAMDIEHVHHALSGADIALWDLLGKKLGLPVWKLLRGLEPFTGPVATHRKIPYASVLFDETPEATFARARVLRGEGYRAVKFGWGPLGQGAEATDVALVRAAREGLGPDIRLLVDAGTAWEDDAATAFARAEAFVQFRVGWLEEPFSAQAVNAYHDLRARGPSVAIAAGEGCSTLRSAEDLIVNGGIDFVQIDAGRIGGITTAWRVRRLAEAYRRHYVNHTFKSRLSLAAALHVFATVEEFDLLEYPAAGSPLSRELVTGELERDADGLINVSERPGLGVTVNTTCVERYLVPVRVDLRGVRWYESGAAE